MERKKNEMKCRFFTPFTFIFSLQNEQNIKNFAETCEIEYFDRQVT